MNNYRKLTMPFFVFLMLIIITSFTISTSRFINKEKWLPEGFNPAKTTLLIQEHPGGEKENDRMIEFIDKEYKWRYEVVGAEQIQNNKKYKNRKFYQYALMWADTASNSLDPGSHSLFHDLDGYFVDLSTGTQYPKSGYGYSYGKNGYKKVIYAIDKAFKDDE
jgi:hypothetical protein